MESASVDSEFVQIGRIPLTSQFKMIINMRWMKIIKKIWKSFKLKIAEIYFVIIVDC